MASPRRRIPTCSSRPTKELRFFVGAPHPRVGRRVPRPLRRLAGRARDRRGEPGVPLLRGPAAADARAAPRRPARRRAARAGRPRVLRLLAAAGRRSGGSTVRRRDGRGRRHLPPPQPLPPPPPAGVRGVPASRAARGAVRGPASACRKRCWRACTRTSASTPTSVRRRPSGRRTCTCGSGRSGCGRCRSDCRAGCAPSSAGRTRAGRRTRGSTTRCARELRDRFAPERAKLARWLDRDLSAWS